MGQLTARALLSLALLSGQPWGKESGKRNLLEQCSRVPGSAWGAVRVEFLLLLASERKDRRWSQAEESFPDTRFAALSVNQW